MSYPPYGRVVSRPSVQRSLLGAALAVLTAACWWVWMAWDTHYQINPATGSVSGPYQVWQVLGCVVCLIGLVVLATTRLPGWLVLPIVPIAFTAAWSWSAASSDDSGLWIIGAVLILFGTLIGTAVCTGITQGVRTRLARSRAAG